MHYRTDAIADLIQKTAIPENIPTPAVIKQSHDRWSTTVSCESSSKTLPSCHYIYSKDHIGYMEIYMQRNMRPFCCMTSSNFEQFSLIYLAHCVCSFRWDIMWRWTLCAVVIYKLVFVSWNRKLLGINAFRPEFTCT